jgi:hypothetical protein
MVVAVTSVQMMDMVTDDVVRVAAVRERFMSAASAMPVTSLMGLTDVPAGASFGRDARFSHVLVDMSRMDVVEMATMKIVDMRTVLDSTMAAVRAVLMLVIGVRDVFAHNASFRSGDRSCLPAATHRFKAALGGPL